MLGELIATRLVADLYRWGDSCVVKLYRPGVPPPIAERESRQAQLASAVGIPTPAVVDVVWVGDRVGIVFERLHGPSMLEALSKNPDRIDDLAAQFADLHLLVHRSPSRGLHSRKAFLEAGILGVPGLLEDAKAAALTALAALPEGDAFCHGDFHPNNILLTAQGPRIIDWYDAARGDRTADVARTIYLLCHATLPAQLDPKRREQLQALRLRFSTLYFEHYAAHSPIAWEKVAAWMLPTAAARLAEPVPPDEYQACLRLVTELLAARGN